jgi:hypothetical protein
METLQLVVLSLLSIVVLSSYYFYLIKDSTTGYINHPFWFGMSPTIIKMLMVFQAFAIIGFLTTIISWIQYPPKEGIMHDNNLFYTISLFLISAAIWPVATQYKIHFLAISSIILTAIASILLLAGTVEERKEDIKWYKILGMLLLCIVTVLVDGVLWNANYIKQLH